jgi:hypothetical protein
MIFLNFSQLSESVFRLNFLGKYFPRNQAKFFLIGKCFSLTNFSNDKQTHESFKNNFSKNKFQKTNITSKIKHRRKRKSKGASITSCN